MGMETQVLQPAVAWHGKGGSHRSRCWDLAPLPSQQPALQGNGPTSHQAEGTGSQGPRASLTPTRRHSWGSKCVGVGRAITPIHTSRASPGQAGTPGAPRGGGGCPRHRHGHSLARQPRHPARAAEAAGTVPRKTPFPPLIPAAGEGRGAPSRAHASCPSSPTAHYRSAINTVITGCDGTDRGGGKGKA